MSSASTTWRRNTTYVRVRWMLSPPKFHVFDFLLVAQFLATPRDLELASEYLLLAYNISGHVSQLFTEATGLPIIIESMEAVYHDRRVMEAKLDRLLQLNLGYVVPACVVVGNNESASLFSGTECNLASKNRRKCCFPSRTTA